MKSDSYGVYLKLNPKTDGDIIEKLEAVTKKQTYIKNLIRDDIKLDNLLVKRGL